MQIFTYSAQNNDSGEHVNAEVQAENEREAAKLLIAQGLFPISIELKGSNDFFARTGFSKRVSAKERVIFTRQLSTLINAGLPLAQSLRTVSEQVSSPALREIAQSIVASVESGTSLSQSFAQFPKVFSDIYVSLVAAGEVSGSLDKALERIANQQEKDSAIVSKIRGALIYPVIVVVVIVAVLVFLLTTVLPQVGSLYAGLHQSLPILTQILLVISNFMTKFWYVMLIAVIALVFGGRSFFKTERGRYIADTAKLKTPVFGKIFQKVYMARFARTLGTMLQSGIPMLEALRIVRDAIDNVHVEAVIDKAMTGVKGGKALSSMLEDQPNFISLVPQMVKIGEQSGAIDSMLDRVATYFENEVDEEVRNISTTIEPVMMVVLGVVVGGVIAAILLPVYSLVGSGAINNLN